MTCSKHLDLCAPFQAVYRGFVPAKIVFLASSRHANEALSQSLPLEMQKKIAEGGGMQSIILEARELLKH